MNNSMLCLRAIRGVIQLTLLIILASAAGWSANIGPDTFGYVATENTPYSFIDISGTGAAVLNGADDDRAIVNLGFPYTFYGTAYDQVCLSTNGLLSFGGCNQMDFANQDITGTAPAGNYPTIAPFWYDLTFAAKGAGAVHYQTLGRQGSRQFVAQWQNAYPLNGSDGITFQVVLSEGSGKVLFQYLDVNAGSGSSASLGGKATIGIRNSDGHASGHTLQWSYRAPVLHNGQAILFVPDSVPPVITGMPATSCRIWPPNESMVHVATVSAADSMSGLASLAVRATSNEPEGKTKDIVITGQGNRYTVQLRAEREGSGNGRVYTITATATDTAGNTATATSTCVVPIRP